MKKTLKLVSLLLACCLLTLSLTACAPTSLEAAKTKMQNAGYTVDDYTPPFSSNEVMGGIYAYKGALFSDTRVSITAVRYESKTAATDAVNNAIFETGAIADECWVYWGDAEAIEAFTKLF